MTIHDLMILVTQTLEQLGIPYAVCGSVASTYYGEARTTHDVGVVADLNLADINRLIARFPSGEFYLSEDAIRGAILRRGQFNILHPESGFKVDVIIPKDAPHDRAQLDRARQIDIRPGVRANFAAPEDVIIKKLQAYEEGGSDKHLRDIASMLKVGHHPIDRQYITDWAERLGLAEIWNLILDKLK